METKNYAKSSEKLFFSTINATIFSLKKRSNCSLNTLESLVTDWYSTFWFFTDASCQTCQSCQTHFGNLSNPLINYIFKIYNYIRALTDFSFSVWQVWQLWQLWQYWCLPTVDAVLQKLNGQWSKLWYGLNDCPAHIDMFPEKVAFPPEKTDVPTYLSLT